MQDERDIWNPTFYHRAIRDKIGATLSAEYDLSQPLPEQIRRVLNQFDEPPMPVHSGNQTRRR